MTSLLAAETGRCDARCREATGPDCRCSCRGQHHGTRWGRPPQLALPLAGPDDFEVAPMDDELRVLLPPEELVPMLIDAAATVDLEARRAEKVGNERDRAAWDGVRDELIAEAFERAGATPVEEPVCAGCGRPESEAPAAYLLDRGRFCSSCEGEARRWPV